MSMAPMVPERFRDHWTAPEHGPNGSGPYKIRSGPCTMLLTMGTGRRIGYMSAQVDRSGYVGPSKVALDTTCKCDWCEEDYPAGDVYVTWVPPDRSPDGVGHILGFACHGHRERLVVRELNKLWASVPGAPEPHSRRWTSMVRDNPVDLQAYDFWFWITEYRFPPAEVERAGMLMMRPAFRAKEHFWW
jgi:hypothetical protein